MASERDDGFATPAAAVICLALSIVAAATTVRGVAEVRLARAEFVRTQAEYALEGAQNAAMVAISTSSRPPPYRWTVASLGEAIQVVAEPERAKMSAQAAVAADDTVLRTLGADDPQAARARLSALAASRDLAWIADIAGSEAWRRCAPAYISGFGAGSGVQALTYNAPQSSQQAGLWRAGEVWRISVSDATGWRDERIVRFTGNGLDPAAVVGRRLSKDLKGQQTCEALFAAASGA